MNEPTHYLEIKKAFLSDNQYHEYNCQCAELKFDTIYNPVFILPDCKSLLFLFGKKDLQIIDFNTSILLEKYTLSDNQIFNCNPVAEYCVVDNFVIFKLYTSHNGDALINVRKIKSREHMSNHVVIFDVKKNVAKNLDLINQICNFGDKEYIYEGSSKFTCSKIFNYCNFFLVRKYKDVFFDRLNGKKVGENKSEETYIINKANLICSIEYNKNIICMCNKNYVVRKIEANNVTTQELYDLEKNIIVLKLEGVFMGWCGKELIENINGKLNYCCVKKKDGEICIKYSDNECCICFTDIKGKMCALVPCGHCNYCAECVKKTNGICAICRLKIDKVLNLFYN
jgi:hypothetical protein